MQLDDHIMKTQAMKVSPFSAPHKEEITAWEKWLMDTQVVRFDAYFNPVCKPPMCGLSVRCNAQIIEEWLKVQAQWMYLEPVFGAEDIIRQMPKEVHTAAVCIFIWGFSNRLKCSLVLHGNRA